MGEQAGRVVSPYLVLGVDYGASGAEAQAAFARKSRRLRQNDGPFTMEEASAALHAIQHAEDDPESTVDFYRVPADPSAYGDGQAASGILNPVPFTLRRLSPPVSAEELLEYEAQVALQAAGRLLADLGSSGMLLAYVRAH